MGKSPAFQFYPNDWLSSPKVAMMTPAQEGAYIRLLCYCWASGDCSLPCDEQQLSILSRLNSIEDLRVVLKCFNQHPTELGKLTNERLFLEVKKQESWREKSAKGGRQSAENKKKSKGGLEMVATKSKPSSSSSSSSSSSYTKEFELFWQAYPSAYRGSKPKTYSAWCRAIRNHEPKEIMNGLEAYIRSTEVANGFTKGATPWLNDERWKRDYKPAKQIKKEGVKANVTTL